MYGCGFGTSFSLVSDDHGASWKVTGKTDHGNEWVAAELVKGSGHRYLLAYDPDCLSFETNNS